MLMRVSHRFISTFYLDTRLEYESKNCYCAVRETRRDIGPYCKRWINNKDLKDKPPFCLLKGDTNAKYCPGAFQFGNSSLYYTIEPTICNKREKGMSF